MRASLRLLFGVLATLLLLTTGCSRYYLSDDVDIVFDFGPTSSDTLNLPYVAGATIGIQANGVDEQDLDRVRLESADDGILHIVSQSRGRAQCLASRSGSVELRMIFDGDVVHTSTIEIKTPTSATLTPRGPMVVGASPAPVTSAKILAGGMSTFLVEYFNDGERLYGHGVLRASAPSDVIASPETTSFFEAREWLQVTPSGTGLRTIDLSAGGVSIGSFDVTGVAESDVDTVAIMSESKDGVSDGSQLALLAQAFDTSREPIFGIDYDWNVDGTVQIGEGDLYRYTFQEGGTSLVTASFGDKSADAVVEQKRGSGFVDSSNHLGCSASAASTPASSTAIFAPALALLALAWRRRR